MFYQGLVAVASLVISTQLSAENVVPSGKYLAIDTGAWSYLQSDIDTFGKEVCARENKTFVGAKIHNLNANEAQHLENNVQLATPVVILNRQQSGISFKEADSCDFSRVLEPRISMTSPNGDGCHCNLVDCLAGAALPVLGFFNPVCACCSFVGLSYCRDGEIGCCGGENDEEATELLNSSFVKVTVLLEELNCN